MLLNDILYDNLICLAYRHRWTPYAGEVGVAGNRWAPKGRLRAIRWVLKCESGCGCEAHEWRDLSGNRISGTNRQYYHTDEYKESTGYTQAEYIAEIRRRQLARDRGNTNINHVG